MDEGETKGKRETREGRERDMRGDMRGYLNGHFEHLPRNDVLELPGKQRKLVMNHGDISENDVLELPGKQGKLVTTALRYQGYLDCRVSGHQTVLAADIIAI